MNTLMTQISSASGFGLWVFEYQKMHLLTGYLMYLGSTRDGINHFKNTKWYCWWKKSCTSSYGKYPFFLQGFIHPNGGCALGFLNHQYYVPGSQHVLLEVGSLTKGIILNKIYSPWNIPDPSESPTLGPQQPMEKWRALTHQNMGYKCYNP